MTSAEINTQISREVLKLKETTFPRLMQEYDRERRKLKVDKNSPYCKDYRIKTAGKNNWIICVNKSLAHPKYRGIQDAAISCGVYYYSEKGIRLFGPEEDGSLNVFNGHFLNRYNERLCLGLSSLTDIMVHFLKNDRQSYYQTKTENGKDSAIAFCKNGMMLGQAECTDRYKWLIWKTFVNKELTRKYQEKTNESLFHYFSKEIEIASQKDDWDVTQLSMLKSVVLAVKGGLAPVSMS